jgi:hypothetical protein
MPTCARTRHSSQAHWSLFMPTLAQKKIVFYAKPELVALLEAESDRTGASVSEVCRRAVVANLKQAPSASPRSTSAPAVLISPKASE